MGALLAKYCIKLTSHILDAIFGGVQTAYSAPVRS